MRRIKGVDCVSKRIRVGIVFGGKSGEHEVSINSAKSVMSALDPNQYEVVPIGIDKHGRWGAGDGVMAQLEAHAQPKLLGKSVDGDNHAPEVEVTLPQATRESGIVPKAVIQEIDVVFPVLHGSFGEDGTIQGMFEMLDLPYVGAGVLTSAVSMDKVFMKRAFAAAQLPQVGYTSYLRKAWQRDADSVISDVEAKIGYPCFVKPANLGSSVGISKAKDRDSLRAAFDLAIRFDRKIIVEEGLDVRECEVAVLGNDEPIASVPGEVTPCNEFYDYQAKYLDGDSVLTIPADLPEHIRNEIRHLAVKAFQAVDGSGLSRVDFFIERGTDKVFVNEINTMPGFTEFSMYPKLWEATGISYSELIHRLIQLAIERFEDRQQTQTDFSFGD
jgi:D-alanine-D-alanine ligase